MHASPDLSRSLKRLRVFFLLVFALSIPFWLLGAATDLQLLPGLSVSALMGFCPMVAALILVYREKGATGALALLRRSFDFKQIESKRWFMPTLFLMPAVSLMVYGVMRWASLPVPPAQFHLFSVLLMFTGFL